ncbi:MAG TPA: hypothetical protein VHG90_12180, partial [Acidimicrobiales bacterium]|nr:hypothetical protein [Acidimicrobiales bacterium]
AQAAAEAAARAVAQATARLTQAAVPEAGVPPAAGAAQAAGAASPATAAPVPPAPRAGPAAPTPPTGVAAAPPGGPAPAAPVAAPAAPVPLAGPAAASEAAPATGTVAASTVTPPSPTFDEAPAPPGGTATAVAPEATVPAPAPAGPALGRSEAPPTAPAAADEVATVITPAPDEAPSADESEEDAVAEHPARRRERVPFGVPAERAGRSPAAREPAAAKGARVEAAEPPTWLPLAGLVVSVWAILPRFLTPPLNTRDAVEIADHVVPGVVVLGLCLGAIVFAQRPGGLGNYGFFSGLVIVLAGLWMAVTHLPLIAQATRGEAPWAGTIYHSASALAMLGFSVIWMAAHWNTAEFPEEAAPGATPPRDASRRPRQPSR